MCTGVRLSWVGRGCAFVSSKCHSGQLALRPGERGRAGSLVLSPNLECLLPRFLPLNENSTCFSDK